MNLQCRLKRVWRSRRAARGLALGLATAAPLIAAGPALAAKATFDYANGLLTYQAASGEANSLTIGTSGQGAIQLNDKGISSISLVQSGGSLVCTIATASRLSCPAGGISRGLVSLGDGNDGLAVTGPMPVDVRAGDGTKDIATGLGDDEIHARNGSADRISCGAGKDVAYADSSDRVVNDCEVVVHGDSNSGPSTPPAGDVTGGTPVTTNGTSGDPVNGGDSTATTDDSAGGAGDDAGVPSDALQTALGLRLPATSIVAPVPNRAIVPLTCSAETTDGCRGYVSIELPAPSAERTAPARVVAARGHYTAQQRKRRSRRLGRRSFKLDAGESVKLAVAVAYRGHYSLASQRNRRRKVVLRVVQRDSAGKVLGVQSRVVTLRSGTRKWSRKRGRR